MTSDEFDKKLNDVVETTPSGVSYTLRALAEKIGCKKGRLEAIEKKAINNFRRSAIKLNLQDYLD